MSRIPEVREKQVERERNEPWGRGIPPKGPCEAKKSGSFLPPATIPSRKPNHTHPSFDFARPPGNHGAELNGLGPVAVQLSVPIHFKLSLKRFSGSPSDDPLPKTRILLPVRSHPLSLVPWSATTGRKGSKTPDPIEVTVERRDPRAVRRNPLEERIRVGLASVGNPQCLEKRCAGLCRATKRVPFLAPVRHFPPAACRSRRHPSGTRCVCCSEHWRPVSTRCVILTVEGFFPGFCGPPARLLHTDSQMRARHSPSLSTLSSISSTENGFAPFQTPHRPHHGERFSSQFRTPASHCGSSSRGPSNVAWSASSSIHTTSSIGSTPSVSTTLDTTCSTQASAGTRRFHFSDVDNFNPSAGEWEDLNQVLLDPEDDSPDTKIAMAEAQSERSKGSPGEMLMADTSFYGIMTSSLDDVARPRTSSSAPPNPFPFRIARVSAENNDGKFTGQDHDHDLGSSAANSSGNSGNASGSRGSIEHPQVGSPFGATPPPAISDGLSPVAPDAWKSRLNRLTPSHIHLQPRPGPEMKDPFVSTQGGFAKDSPDSILDPGDQYPSPAEVLLPPGMDKKNADDLEAKERLPARSRKVCSRTMLQFW